MADMKDISQVVLILLSKCCRVNSDLDLWPWKVQLKTTTTETGQ